MKELNITNYQSFENSYFEIIDEELLVASLNYYIRRQNANAKITAKNYISNITKFFNMLADDYGLTNQIFKDKDKYEQLKNKASEIIDKLNDKAKKEIASENDYNLLNEKINLYCKTVDKEKKYIELELQKSYETSSNRADKYIFLVSCITTKMVLLYGMKNKEILNLKIDDIDIQTNTIKVSKYFLIIDEKLNNLIEVYLECRNLILLLNNIKNDNFFINHKGKLFVNSDGNLDADKFFRIVKHTFENVSIDPFSNRRKMEMIRLGQDICTISEKTGSSIASCEVIQRIFNEEVNADSNIYDSIEEIKPFSFDKSDENEEMVTTDYMICPNCHSHITPAESDWVLLLKDNGIKYLVCKNCKGVI